MFITLELEECIKDAVEDSMKEYMQSEEYVQQKQEKADDMISSFRINLHADQQLQLNKIIDVITSIDGNIALEAYIHGVVEGIALQNKFVK